MHMVELLAVEIGQIHRLWQDVSADLQRTDILMKIRRIDTEEIFLRNMDMIKTLGGSMVGTQLHNLMMVSCSFEIELFNANF
jgi:hypothetical protein